MQIIMAKSTTVIIITAAASIIIVAEETNRASMRQRAAKMDTARAVSIVSRRAVFSDFAVLVQEEDAERNSVHAAFELDILKRFSKRSVIIASPFMMMAAL